jgi:hypothetical protein
MQSDGGLTPMDAFNGSRAILSGPAGGVVGYAMTTRAEQVLQASVSTETFSDKFLSSNLGQHFSKNTMMDKLKVYEALKRC